MDHHNEKMIPLKQLYCTLWAILWLGFILSFVACSAYMVAQKKGVPLEEIQKCQRKSDLIAKKDIELIETKKCGQGETEETYRVLKEKGSYTKSALYLIVSIFSFGLTEFEASPKEYAEREAKEYYYIKVRYDDKENIRKVELIQQ